MAFNNKRKYKAPHYIKKYNDDKPKIVHMAQFKTYQDFERRMNVVVNLIQKYRRHRVIDKKFGSVFIGQNDPQYLELVKEFNELQKGRNMYMSQRNCTPDHFTKDYKRPVQFQNASISLKGFKVQKT